MTNYNFETVVRFKTNKNYLFKKILTIGAIIAYFTYLIISCGIADVLISFFSMILMLCLTAKIRNFKGIGKKLKSFFKNMYKYFVVDVYPLSFDIKEDELTLQIKNAELFNKLPTTEIFNIKKEDINQICYFADNKMLNIFYNNASISLTNTKKTFNKTQGLTCLTIYIPEQYINNIIENLKSNNFKFEYAKEKPPEKIKVKKNKDVKNSNKDSAKINEIQPDKC